MVAPRCLEVPQEGRKGFGGARQGFQAGSCLCCNGFPFPSLCMRASACVSVSPPSLLPPMSPPSWVILELWKKREKEEQQTTAGIVPKHSDMLQG